MNLDRALKNPSAWTRDLEPSEIAMVNEEARWVGSKFAKVRETIMNDDLKKAGKEFLRLLEALPDDFKRDFLGLTYLERTDDQKSENPT